MKVTAAELDAALRLKRLHDAMLAEGYGPPDPAELLRRFEGDESDRAVNGFYARFRQRDIRAEPDAVTTLPSHQENP